MGRFVPRLSQDVPVTITVRARGAGSRQVNIRDYFQSFERGIHKNRKIGRLERPIVFLAFTEITARPFGYGFGVAPGVPSA